MNNETSTKSGNFKRTIFKDIQSIQASTSGVKSVKKAKRPKKDNSESEEQREEIILQSDTDVENDLTDDHEDWMIMRIFLSYVRNQSLMNL